MNYAKINNDNNICEAVLLLSIEPSDTIDFTYVSVKDVEAIGKKWNGETFEDVLQVHTIEELRQEAYSTATKKLDDAHLIDYRNAIYTCDSAYKQLSVYEEEDKYAGTSKAQELGLLWTEAKDYIRSLTIEELTTLLSL